ncbi:unnamed protein product [Moneuplotes crassus]|uniref:Uncharacterized protein n=1 Tax=Euplotes crassus TaxID=5936 RepID=A0AAD1UHD7_EUPCR|nr:unnamed protein product [Moneuplotes crassus]
MSLPRSPILQKKIRLKPHLKSNHADGQKHNPSAFLSNAKRMLNLTTETPGPGHYMKDTLDSSMVLPYSNHTGVSGLGQKLQCGIRKRFESFTNAELRNRYQAPPGGIFSTQTRSKKDLSRSFLAYSDTPGPGEYETNKSSFQKKIKRKIAKRKMAIYNIDSGKWLREPRFKKQDDERINSGSGVVSLPVSQREIPTTKISQDLQIIITKGRVVKVIEKEENSVGPGSYNTDISYTRKSSKSIVPWSKPKAGRENTLSRSTEIGPGSYNIDQSNRMVLKRSSNTIFPRVGRYRS